MFEPHPGRSASKLSGEQRAALGVWGAAGRWAPSLAARPCPRGREVAHCGHMCGLCRMLWGWWDHCTDFYVAGSACFHLPGKWLSFVKEESDLAGNGGTNTVLYHVEPANVFMPFPFFFREGSCQLCCRGGRGGGACEGVHGRPVATLGEGGALFLQQTVACPQSPSLFHLCSRLQTPPRGLAPWLRCRFAPRGALAETRGGALSPSQLSASEPPWCFQPFLRGPQMDRGQPLLCYCLARGE